MEWTYYDKRSATTWCIYTYHYSDTEWKIEIYNSSWPDLPFWEDIEDFRDREPTLPEVLEVWREQINDTINNWKSSDKPSKNWKSSDKNPNSSLL